MHKTSWFTIKRVHAQVFALAEFHHWEKVVSYLVLGSTKAVLVDTSLGYGDIKEVVRKITSLPIQVLLTHGHWDHLGGVGNFSSIAIYNDTFDKNLLLSGFKSAQIRELREKKYFNEPYQPKEYAVKGLRKFTALEEGEIIDCGDLHIQVIHTGGHTPGSACYLVKELNIICTGDTIYPGPLYAHLPESDLIQYAVSVKKLKKLANKNTIFFPGHNATICNWELLARINTAFDSILSGRAKGIVIGNRKEYSFGGFSILTKA
ncbi:MAG: MBL fold metallo-hydrolase [Patescibacteria group bacterium]